jgi:hypothetical protein
MELLVDALGVSIADLSVRVERRQRRPIV